MAANDITDRNVKSAGIMVTLGNKLKSALQSLEKNEGCTEVKENLKEALDLANGVNQYVVTKSTPLSSVVSNVVEETASLNFDKLRSEGQLKSNITDVWKWISATGQVQLLQFLIRSIKAKNILEIGTYMGYGAFAMAEAMALGGQVTGIEIVPHFCKFVNEKANKSNLNIHVKEGAALDVLKSLAKEGHLYDFIYIDCKKEEYADYFKIIMDNNMLRPGGMIACDNVLFMGSALTRSDTNGIAMNEFGSLVAQDNRVRQVMLPCYDGILLIQHNSESN